MVENPIKKINGQINWSINWLPDAKKIYFEIRKCVKFNRAGVVEKTKLISHSEKPQLLKT